jgi:hypothetical protein
MLRHICSSFAVVVVLAAASSAQTPAPTPAVDITGKWTASFETQIGIQNYTYEFQVKDKLLTGKASSDNGSCEIKDGKVDGPTVSFTEILTFMEMQIPITYTGQVASTDEIRFTRVVGEFATEELVAKRVK